MGLHARTGVRTDEVMFRKLLLEVFLSKRSAFHVTTAGIQFILFFGLVLTE